MTQPAATMVSVRGEARREVPPDLATITCALRLAAGSKADALRLAAAALETVTSDLRDLGAVALVAGDDRRPLMWTAYSATTRVETEWTSKLDRPMPTGRIVATVALRVDARDFAVINRLDAALAAHEDLHVEHVEWWVDADNPAWPEVRAAAIEAAIRKGRDYAAALNGSLVRLEHVADAGLLGGNQRGIFAAERASFSGLAASAAPDGDTPSLDPVPQELVAVIEARFAASVRPLA